MAPAKIRKKKHFEGKYLLLAHKCSTLEWGKLLAEEYRYKYPLGSRRCRLGQLIEQKRATLHKIITPTKTSR